MSEGIKNCVSNICTGMSVLMLVYTLFYNYFVNDIIPQETIFADLVDYIIAFLPIIVGVLFHIGQIVDEGFHGSKTVKYLLKPIIFFITAGANFFVINKFDMYIGLQFQINNLFLVGLLILMGIAVMEASLFAYLENDSIHAVFTRSTFWISWLTLAAVNGGVEASKQISSYLGNDFISVWVKFALLYTILFAVFLFFYVLLAIIALMFGLK